MDAARVPGRSRTGSLSTRLYAALLRAYPAEFRRRYADEMIVLFADQLREARRSSEVAGVWLRSLADVTTNAVGEHLRRDRTVAQSVATFEPTRPMRVAGILAVVGGVLLLWAFISWNPFSERSANWVRLALFGLSGIAVALAYHRRQAAVRPFLARAATGAVVVVGAWNELWLALAWDRDSPFGGDFGMIGFVAGFLGWIAASVYGAAMLVIAAAWLGMGRVTAVVTRLAAALLVVAGPVATLGMDRLGLTRSESYGELFTTLGMVGVMGVGLAWLVLGLVLVAGGRRIREAQ
jgi:hypothetical protein